MSQTRLEKLIAAQKRLETEYEDLGYRLEQAKKAVLEERFADTPQYKVGDVILVQRKLFGKPKPWPARVIQVFLNYDSGTLHGSGEPWEYKFVSYHVEYQLKDGSFDGESHGYQHNETSGLAPAREAS